MGDFSNFKNITRINEILNHIDPLQNTINLSNNFIKKANLDVLPDNITNVCLDNNKVNMVSWDDRPWGTISIKNNNFDTGEFDGFECNKLILDNNDIREITFANCKINYLSIVNNNITNINFFDCYIKFLDLSANKINNIITLPLGLERLNIYGNKIKEISSKLCDSIIHLDLSDNRLKKIPNFPLSLKYLDLSKNNFESIDSSLIPTTLEYFDITNNNIKNNTELFKKLSSNIVKIYYDTDSEDEYCNKDKLTDEVSESSDSDLSSVKLNYQNKELLNGYKEIKIDSDSDSSSLENILDFENDEDINNAINEYRNEIEEHKDNEFRSLENNRIENVNFDNSHDLTNNIDNIISSRELMLKAAIERFRNNKKEEDIQKEMNKKVYLPLIPIKLKWNINLN